ncbi:MAG: GlsB/YeaQ/YmgE family stress response membrane protein [Acidimicrobiales bacterium]
MGTDKSMLAFLLTLALFGLIVGAIARLLVPGPSPMGILGTMAAGVAGAFLGGLVGKLLWGQTYTPGWLMSILGAMVVVWAVTRRRAYYY